MFSTFIGVGDHREGQHGAVEVGLGPASPCTPVSVPVPRPDPAQAGVVAGGEPVGQRAGEARDGEVDHMISAQLAVLVRGRADHREERLRRDPVVAESPPSSRIR